MAVGSSDLVEAPAEALPHAHAAVEVVRGIPDGDVLERTQALIALGRVQSELGDWSEARRTAREGSDIIESGMIRERSALAGARALLGESGRARYDR